MPADISVIIGVYADNDDDMRKWVKIAQPAIASTHNQTAKPLEAFISCAKTLHEARNNGADTASGKYLLFLDADDELDPGYVEAMWTAIQRAEAEHPGQRFLFGPATLGVTNGVEDASGPVLIPERPLHTGNFLVIGTVLEKVLFEEVGGFQDWPAWEDWALFLRCHTAGAGVIRVPDAVYRVHVNPVSRNQSAANDRRLFKNILLDHQHWKAHR